MKKHIPNFITCLNLFSGCIACVVALQGNFTLSLVWVITAAVFDFFDGFAARLLKAYSPIGKELDSLADVISFGVAPGMVIFIFLSNNSINLPPLGNYVPYLAFIIPAFSALRLAKFNLDERQSESFIGLPVPANALFWCALIPALDTFALPGREVVLTVGILVLAILFSCLLVSEIPMFSLKFKHYAWAGNENKYILIIIAVLAFCLLKIPGISFTICTYIIMSLFAGKSKK